jgi:hypothetical protein
MRKLPANKALALILSFCLTISCTTVKEYQRARADDVNMELGNRDLEEFESNFQSYKEGAVGGNNGNGGAGCGCN